VSNFDFVKAEWPAIHADCVRAESYLSSDPAAACFYARRSLEQLVGHLYEVTGLAAPYQNDLAARLTIRPSRQRSASGSRRSAT